MNSLNNIDFQFSRKAFVGTILTVALIAFEIFNFDTTRYALNDLLGHVTFMGIGWASILAIAFCAIDFAGLARIFTPERGAEEPQVTWYLMGAWMLGATMNAMMTWWAISLTLLNHQLGNEVLSREQLLAYVPVFIAVLVWLTRILFIGAFSVASDHIFNNDTISTRPPARKAQPVRTPQRAKPAYASPQRQQRPSMATQPRTAQVQQQPKQPIREHTSPISRVQRRPPMPSSVRQAPAMQTKGRPR